MAAIIVSSNRQFARLKPDIELGQTTSQLLKMEFYIDRQQNGRLCEVANGRFEALQFAKSGFG